MFSIIYPSFDVESVQFILNEKHTRISSTRLSCFGYVLWVCLSDYTGIMDRAFKGTLVCFSLSLKDTRGSEGMKREGRMFLFYSFNLRLKFLSVLLCDMSHVTTFLCALTLPTVFT